MTCDLTAVDDRLTVRRFSRSEPKSYTQFVPLHDPDKSLSILPIGNSDDPASAYRFSTYGDWSRGRLHPAPLSRNAVGHLAVSQETLGRQHG